MTPQQRTLIIWKNKLEERDKLISTLEYTEDNFEKIDKLLSNSKSIWDKYMACVKEYEKTKTNQSTMAGEQESLLDSGTI